MWAPHLNLALFPLHTLIHSLEMIPSQLVGLQFMLWFESTPTLWPRDMKFAFSSIAHWIVWWLPDSMNMTWRTLFLATTSFRHGHHMNVEHAFLESIEVLSNDYQEECTFSSVADYTFSRTPKRILHPFLHEHISLFFLERPEGKQKVLCTMQ